MAGVHTGVYEADQKGDCPNIGTCIHRKKTKTFDELTNKKRYRERGKERERESLMCTNSPRRVQLLFCFRLPARI